MDLEKKLVEVEKRFNELAAERQQVETHLGNLNNTLIKLQGQYELIKAEIDSTKQEEGEVKPEETEKAGEEENGDNTNDIQNS